eukprot:gnl/Carplike_NY0171/1292_a1753_233.p1 GENE.gnl/Carplike_NY0171/1292_a1753_233~~gnl/Carplike_NY0171/1292_a1753_233.p1  ORF type:complete len:272 (-),score=67.11 gnl/Carplike_NY0171/1292_a1753_233:33-848(-)
MSSFTTTSPEEKDDVEVQIVEPSIVDLEFIREGSVNCCPISRDTPDVMSPEFPKIKARDGTFEGCDEEYDNTDAQDVMFGEEVYGSFSHISIPFSSSSPIKGVYICYDGFGQQRSLYLIFTFSSSSNEKTSRKCYFPEYHEDDEELFHKDWFYLPIDLSDVVLCEISGKGRQRYGRKNDNFAIESLVFVREETSEEAKIREAKENLWSEAPVVKPEFVKEGDKESKGRDSIPILRDDPKLVDPSFSMVKCKDNSVSYESRYYDKSFNERRG